MRRLSLQKIDMDDGGGYDDAFEALFKQLEEDLMNNDLSVEDDDDGISEEILLEIGPYERENGYLRTIATESTCTGRQKGFWAAHICVTAHFTASSTFYTASSLCCILFFIKPNCESSGDSLSGSEGYGNDEERDEAEQSELKNWQLRRLARALKIGCHKTIITNLAGELALDRALVIEWLRNSPPKLLLMSDALPDEAPSKPEIKEIEPSPVVDEVDATETKPQMGLPIHVMSAEWSVQKRF